MGILRRAVEAAYEALRINPDALDVDPESAPRITAGSGAPSASDPDGSIYLRTDGGVNTSLYVMSTTYQAIPTAAGADAIADTNTYYTTDTIDGALDALALQVGGTSDAAYGFTEDNVLADNDALYAALDKLDLKWGDLASTANGEGAALVGLEDAGGYTATTSVEAAIAEIYANLVTVTLSAGAEASNVIAVTVNLVSITGAAVSRTQRLVCSLYEATGIEAIAALFTMAETGTGTEISTTGNARLIIETDANGDAVVSVTDVATASGKTMYLIVQPCPPSGTNEYGLPAMVAITFD